MGRYAYIPVAAHLIKKLPAFCTVPCPFIVLTKVHHSAHYFKPDKPVYILTPVLLSSLHTGLLFRSSDSYCVYIFVSVSPAITSSVLDLISLFVFS